MEKIYGLQIDEIMATQDCLPALILARQRGLRGFRPFVPVTPETSQKGSIIRLGKQSCVTAAFALKYTYYGIAKKEK